jgi:exopolyphosphatase/guanosine-5'-triphosphate,3'-diphosphate pyrophosphatase
MPLAAIDIGTNSILLLVAERTDHTLTPLIDLAKTVRLGESLGATGKLSEIAMARTLTGLSSYAKALEQFSPDQVICFGTAALRVASNAAEFCQQVNAKFGWPVQILTGEEEAHYTFRGVMSALAADHPDALAIDIGGGSTEVIAGTRDRIYYQTSLPVGAVVLQEQFHLGERVSPAHQKIVETTLTQQFATLVIPDRNSTILVTGGTATTLAALDQQLTRYDIQRIEGYGMDRGAIATLYHQLNQLSHQERAALPGMKPGRADIILPALLILLTLLTHLQANRIQITVRGARYGLLLK